VGFTAILQNDGSLTISIASYEIETSLTFLIAITAALFLLLFLFIFFFVRVKFGLDKYKLNKQNKNQKLGLQEITKSLSYIALGDHKKAALASSKVKKYLGNVPISNLLEIQTSGNKTNPLKLKKHFKAMLEHDETKSFALKGLGSIAQKNNKDKQAANYFEEALKAEPHSANLTSSLLNAYIKLKKWQKAEELLRRAFGQKILHKTDYSYDYAAINLQLGDTNLTQGNQQIALKYFKTAIDYAPNFQPAILAYAALLLELGKTYKAAYYIKNIWKTTPSKELAEIYTQLHSKKKLSRKLSYLEKLIKLNKQSIEGQILYAENAIGNDKYRAKAKGHLTNALETSPSPRIYELLAQIAEQENENPHVADDLRKKAKHTIESNDWLCNNCHEQADKWQIKCPKCQSFNSLQSSGYSRLRFIQNI
jgi:HemY protein